VSDLRSHEREITALNATISALSTQVAQLRADVDLIKSWAHPISKDGTPNVGFAVASDNASLVLSGGNLNIGAHNYVGLSSSSGKVDIRTLFLSVTSQGVAQIKVGSSEFSLKSSGDIELKGTNVTITASGALTLKASKIVENSSLSRSRA
jgi:hypothetical protein